MVMTMVRAMVVVMVLFILFTKPEQDVENKLRRKKEPCIVCSGLTHL
jgi:hypothetical protein